MKRTLVPILVSLSLSAAASAALTIHVDATEKEYYLSGSATGLPEENFFSGSGQIAWDNGETLDGGFETILSEAAFSVANNTSSGSFILFLHGNGNVNGAFDFETADLTTLTGNSSLRFDYSGWAPALQTELEAKAAGGDIVPVANGASSSFNLSFQAVPEPGPAALISIALLGLAFSRRRPAQGM